MIATTGIVFIINASQTRLHRNKPRETKSGPNYGSWERSERFLYTDVNLPGDGEYPATKSIILGSSPGQFHEILVREIWGPGSAIFPTIISGTGEDAVIQSTFDGGGMYHELGEDCFVILKTGAALLDLGPVEKAAVGAAAPAGMIPYNPMSRYDFEAHVFTSETEPIDLKMGPQVSCCEGHVEVRFKIENGRVIPGKAEFFPK